MTTQQTASPVYGNDFGINADKIIDYGAIACVGLIIFGGVQLATSIVIALMSVVAFTYIFFTAKDTSKLGAKIWNAAMKYRVTTDVVLTVMFTMFFGTTIVGLASAGSAGIFMSCILNKASKNIGFVDLDKYQQGDIDAECVQKHN